jgi:hypothetical protein
MAGGRTELPAGAAGHHGLGHGTVQHPHRRTRLRQGPHEQLGEYIIRKTSNTVHCNKRLAIFPSPAGMSLTKLSLAGNDLIFPDQGELGK